MMRLSFALLAAVILTQTSVAAEQSPYAEDMRFIRELRTHGYSDLAREYLEKLSKTAPPELKKELPLEIALTNMEAAGDEPDSNKRLALYAQARADFEKFLKDNPKHPRADEARFDIAHATTLQGKTQLSRALLEDDIKARVAEGLKARATLAEAFKQLKALPSTAQSELAMGLNLIDQAQTFLNTGSDTEMVARAKPVQEAQKLLEKLAQGSGDDKITWTARAWVGKCIHELGEPKKALEKYLEITSTPGQAASDGRRLARYFILLVAKETREAPNKRPFDAYIVERTSDWIRDYPSYARTPEGYGIRFLLAEMLLAETNKPKITKGQRDLLIVRARKYLRDIERTENDFTDRAKRLKIAAMDKQGAFKDPIDKLKTFEDCYVRAQYEIMQIGEDAKKYKDNRDQIEGARKARIRDAITSLESGLQKPDAKTPTTETNNARAMLAYYLMTEGKHKESIQIGETFARNDPRSGQAAMAAIYALLSYGEMLGQRERAAADMKALQDDKQYQDDRAHMLDLAKYMEERWPKDRAGDLARHQIALRLLRDEKNPDAIQKLSAITPTYPSYIRTQFMLARAALQQAAQDKDMGDPKGYHKLALTALATMPDPAPTADPDTNRDYVQAKLTLASELARDKQFKQLDALVAMLLPKVAALHLHEDKAKDDALRGKVDENITQLSLYSKVAQADIQFKAGKYAEVSKMLDPIVDEFNAGKLPQMKESDLTAPILGLALKANVQLNNLDRAKLVIKALQNLQSDKGGDKGTMAILSQLVSLITQQVEDLRKKDDKEALKKAQAGFTSILGEVAGVQKKPTPRLAYLLARCYAGMDEHKRAADLLRTFAAQEVAGDGGPDVQIHHAIQLLLIQELRQLKELDKAQTLLDSIIAGKDGKPGWGARNLDAQKQRIMLLEDKENYGAAVQLANKLMQQMKPRIEDNKIKEQYLELYYHETYCILKNGQGLSNADLKTRSIKTAAQRIIKLERSQGNLNTEESKKRFDELLSKEADLREQYNAMKDAK